VIESTSPLERSLYTRYWRDERPGTAHDRFLHSWRRENMLLGGRGTHKTGFLVAKDAISANLINPGSVSYLTEQTAGKIRDILLPVIRRLINPDLYELRSVGQEYDLRWKQTGSITRLRSRQAKRIHDDPPFRGPSATCIGHDEIARDPSPPDQDRDPIKISRAMLRGDAGRVKLLNYTTTPVRNWFYSHANRLGVTTPGHEDGCRLIETGRAAAYYTSTREIDPELYNDLIGEYDERFARQELEAEWVALEGRVWTGWRDWDGTKNTLWPHSNRHWHVYDPNRPTLWGVDLGGAQSAWLVCQSVPATDQHGVRVLPGNILVAVGESTPSATGAWASLGDLVARFGRPYAAYIGADYRTPGTDGGTAEMAFTQRGIRATPITGWQAGKDIQGQHAASMLLNTAGERRFAVSTELISLQARAGRGILEVMEGDLWPEPGSSSYFLKDKKNGVGLEDMRDAWLYLLVGHTPPKWAEHTKHAGA
jgi:hypothetical protein